MTRHTLLLQKYFFQIKFDINQIKKPREAKDMR